MAKLNEWMCLNQWIIGLSLPPLNHIHCIQWSDKKPQSFQVYSNNVIKIKQRTHIHLNIYLFQAKANPKNIYTHTWKEPQKSPPSRLALPNPNQIYNSAKKWITTWLLFVSKLITAKTWAFIFRTSWARKIKKPWSSPIPDAHETSKYWRLAGCLA